ncbi:hypothetical protein ACFL6I_10245 [candidate division KSB1 bacterium]
MTVLFPTDIHSVPIPQIFHSDVTKEPIKNCIDCDVSLIDSNKHYLIEKAFSYNKDYEVRNTIFEYAICYDCAMKLRESLSDESKKNMNEFFEKHSSFTERSEQLIKEKDFELDKWIGNCMINGTPVNDTNEYQIFCQCQGDQMLFTYMPYMISGEALEEMAELLSDKTRDEMDGFMDDHFGVPPDYEEFFTRKKLLIV